MTAPTSLGIQINQMAARYYATGTEPIHFAEELVCSLLEVIPEQHTDLADDTQCKHASRRILGLLLEAGWTPPEVTP